MTDDHDDLYALVRTEFEPVRLQDSLDDITARGRVLRRRRRAGLTAGVTAGLTAVAAVTGLALSVPTGVPTDQPAQMNLAASSVESAPDGTVRLTIRQLHDPDKLTAALKAAGLPALVELQRIPAKGPQAGGCVDNDQQGLDQLGDVISREDTEEGVEQGMSKEEAAEVEAAEVEEVFIIRPDRMPSGASLHVVIFQFEKNVAGYGVHGARGSLINLVKGTPLPCEPLWNNEAALKKRMAEAEAERQRQPDDKNIIVK
jgi:hypothetical protein